MTACRVFRVAATFAVLGATVVLLRSPTLGAAVAIQSPEQFIGFRVGADNKLARWDTIVEYMKLVAANSDRIRYRELGKTNAGNAML